MITKQNIARLALSLSISLSAAAQAGDNPLQPAHYWGKSDAAKVQSTRERYIDANNPLAPSFNVKAEWQGTVANIEPYVDNNNPLQPTFKK